jgi:signal peptidase II
MIKAIRRNAPIPYVVGVWFILCGAIGNGVDRLRHDAVVDYISVWIWPIFNISDVLIVAGAILLVWYILVYEKKRKQVLFV